MKKSTEKAERLNIEDSNKVAKFLGKLGMGEFTDTLVLERGHIRAVTLDNQPGDVDLDATKPVNGRIFHDVIKARIHQGLIFKARTGKVFRVFQSNSSVPPASM